VGATQIPYEVRYSEKAKRKRIIVTPSIVEVIVPLGVTMEDTAAFVHNKRRWVYDETEKMSEQTLPTPQRFMSGSKVPYRGRMMKLLVMEADVEETTIEYRSGFNVQVPDGLESSEKDNLIQRVFEQWFRDRLWQDADAFVRRYGPKLGVEPKGIRIKEQKHLWASCGKDGVINLNRHLITLPKPILEYTVVHELCHLKHRNHSPEFWSLVRSLLPDYERRKKWLDNHFWEGI
ncbi:MAG TPA: SprT family zinc-dependent metalloprotease, partial [Chroococcales cyanobacterium]